MIFYKCDRCGKEFSTEREIKQLNMSVLEGHQGKVIKKLDVCLPCLNLIKLFISEVYCDK